MREAWAVYALGGSLIVFSLVATGENARGDSVERLPPVDSQQVLPAPEPPMPPGVIEDDSAEPDASEPSVDVDPTPPAAGHWTDIVWPEFQQPLKLWEGSFELGLDGTEGNSQTLNYRVGLDLTRESERWEIDLDLDYNRKTNQSVETTNRTFFDWRLERLFGESPWTLFIHGTIEHDEYEPYDLRVTSDAGVGYRLIRTEATKLTTRVGGGFSREFGLPNDEEYWVPEATFGVQFEHRFGERHKVKLHVEHMPDVTDFTEYRINTEASWEMLVDEEMNLSLKLGVLDRYDSTPNGAKRNDLDYSIVLLWQF
jgi:putative salt-induced outer membrane protein YdiY